jgi:predicted DNA-binding transcriptional regulator YafY
MAKTLLVDGEHLSRLMKLCRTVHQSGSATLPQLQAKLKTSRRTVFRDMSTLSMYGIQVSSSSDGYRIKQNPNACKKALGDHFTKEMDQLLKAALK